MKARQTALARAAVPIVALCLCASVEPRDRSGFVLCPFRLLTGLPCPFCGMTRALASIVRMRFAEGVEYHLFSPLVAGGLLAWFLVEIGEATGLWNGDRLRGWAMRPAPWIAFTAVAAIYTAMRWCGILTSTRL